MPLLNMLAGCAEESSQRNAADKGKTWRRVQEQEPSLGNPGNSNTMLAMTCCCSRYQSPPTAAAAQQLVVDSWQPEGLQKRKEKVSFAEQNAHPQAYTNRKHQLCTVT